MSFYPNLLASGKDGVVRHQTTYDSVPTVRDALVIIKVMSSYYDKVYCAWVSDSTGNVVRFDNYTDALGNVADSRRKDKEASE